MPKIAEIAGKLLPIAGGILIGIQIGQWVYDPTYYPAPVETTMAERRADLVEGTTVPGSILVTFEPKSQIEKERPGAYAYSTWSGTEGKCKIYLPSGWTIRAHPSDEDSAYWASMDADETIAHEMLHCLRGRWHNAP